MMRIVRTYKKKAVPFAF